jgi:hypothetical protein
LRVGASDSTAETVDEDEEEIEEISYTRDDPEKMYTEADTETIGDEENKKQFFNALWWLIYAQGAFIWLHLASMNGDFEAFYWYAVA